VHVYDLDPQVRERDRASTVKIAASQMPALPEPSPGMPFRSVEFDELTVTPYMGGTNERPRVAYSLRAKAVRPAGARPSAKPNAA